MSAIDWSILWPACVAGFVVTAMHVPLGLQVLDRGIVFIDLAIAQIASVGVVIGHSLGFESGWAVQACALGAAVAGASLLTWSDRRYREAQEAIIGSSFVLAASVALLLLAHDPHGSEHLKELLVGQILWVDTERLATTTVVYALILGAITARPRLLCRRLSFYLLFAVVVTISVQLVGVYLVFASLIIPALATRKRERHRHLHAYGISLAGYVSGIALSAVTDLPTGPTIVCAMVGVAAIERAARHAYRTSV